MFAHPISRTGRHISQAARRLARPGHVRGYAAAASESASSSTGSGRRAASVILLGLGFTGVGATGAWYAMTKNGMGFHSDEASLTRFKPSDDDARLVEETINKHPLVAELRRNPNLTESRPHMKMPTSIREQSLTGGAMMRPGMLVVPPYAWVEPEGKSFVSVSYIGDQLCGHPGIVHGGCLATMLDEGLARCCFEALPYKIGVTANLNIDYRKPAPANSYLVLRAETTKVEGRKAWVKGHIELLAEPGEKPVILAEATGLFVSPKYAAMMPRIG